MNGDEVMHIRRLFSCQNFVGRRKELVFNAPGYFFYQWRDRRMRVMSCDWIWGL